MLLNSMYPVPAPTIENASLSTLFYGRNWAQFGKQVHYPRDPFSHSRDTRFYFQSIGTGKLVVAAALEKGDNFCRIHGRIGSKLNLNGFAACLNADDSQRRCSDTQTVAIEQCLDRIRQ